MNPGTLVATYAALAVDPDGAGVPMGIAVVGMESFWLPWLLLLVPTLLIGASALWLLWQEQRRIDEAAAEASETDRAAVASLLRLSLSRLGPGVRS